MKGIFTLAKYAANVVVISKQIISFHLHYILILDFLLKTGEHFVSRAIENMGPKCPTAGS